MTGRVIVITSGKGGVGKTTTSANIGTALAKEGYKVVLIDTDLGLRNLDLLLGLENRIVYTIVDVIEEKAAVDTIPVAEKIQKVLSFYNLGKSHLCKITGISRPALYAWIDGNSEPDTENFAKVEQLYAIAREFDVTGTESIHHGYIDKALPGKEKSLYQLFVENSKLDIDSIKNLVQVALNKSISRAENIAIRRSSEFQISHSDADKELNLERNL